MSHKPDKKKHKGKGKPPASLRDMSYHQAQAGAAAQTAAAAQGGDLTTLLALSGSVQAGEPICIRGEPLHGWSLQVILDLQLATDVLGDDPVQKLGGFVSRTLSDAASTVLPNAEELTWLGVAGFIFSRPFEAFQALSDVQRFSGVTPEDAAAARQDFRAEALRVVGAWTPAEIGLFIRHLILLGKPAAAGAKMPPA